MHTYYITVVDSGVANFVQLYAMACVLCCDISPVEGCKISPLTKICMETILAMDETEKCTDVHVIFTSIKYSVAAA